MSRSFSFFRAGGFDQVQFTSGADLVNLDALDQKLWVALACPTKGLAFDSRTLELFDSEKDGRIRATELMGAAKWVGALLQNPDTLLEGKAELPLTAISEGTPEGKQLLATARSILESLGKTSAGALSVADTMEATKAHDARLFNGDGVVTLAATDEATKALAQSVIDSIGPVVDRSGAPGFTAETVTGFFAAIAEHAAWLGSRNPKVLPLGDATGAAHEALQVVRGKIDDFFARCRLAAFDARALAAVNREEKEYLALAAKDLTITSDEVAAFPLSRVEASRSLPLAGGLNPAWEARVQAFVSATVKPVLGELTVLTEPAWRELCGRFSAYETWLGTRAGAKVEKLGAERVLALASPGARAPLDALLEKEKEQAPIAESLASVEKLVRFHRDLHRLAMNFVSFREFYTRKSPAIFQVGTLFLDQRACELCLRVEDVAKHAVMAPLSRAYLAYCDCVRPSSGDKMTIVAAVTAGDSDNLMVGRNGIFYDRDGRDWDATVTKLIENPISVRQAFWSPYKKVIRFVEDQVAKRAADADKSSNELLTTKATTVAKAADGGKPDEKVATKLDIGVVAALGVAVGGLTAAFGAILQSFFGLGLWMPFGLLGLLLLISGPSMLIAWLKLRQRNIGPLLDANGWAINANARMNIPFGASLTQVAKLPPGSRVDTRDPYAEVRRPWGLYLTLLVLLSLGLAWYLGRLDGLLPPVAKSTSVLGAAAPATHPAPAPAAEPAPSK